MKRIFAFILIFLMLGFAACSLGEPVLDNSSAPDKSEKSTIDVLAIEWKAPKKAEPAEKWEVLSYTPISTKTDGNAYLIDKSVLLDEGMCYALLYYMSVVDEKTYYFYEIKCVNLMSEDNKVIRIDMRNENMRDSRIDEIIDSLNHKIENGFSQITTWDITDDGFSLFFAEWDEEWYLDGFYRIEFNLNGTINSLIDLTDVGLKIAGNEANAFNLPDAVCGEDNSVYLIDQQNKNIWRHDNESCELVLIANSEGDFINFAGKSGNETPVFSVNTVGEETVFFTIEEGKEKEIFKASLGYYQCIIDHYGNVLSLSNSTLSSWNVQSGMAFDLYSFEGLSGYSCMDVATDADGRILICYSGDDSIFVYTLSKNVNLDQVQLNLLMNYEDSYVKKCVADFNRTHAEIKIATEIMQNNDDYEWAKLLEKIKSGLGPDMLLLNRSRLEDLQSAGVVSDLDDLMQLDSCQNIFNGTLNFGIINGTLYAVPYEAYMGTLFVDSKNWSDSDWTLDETIRAFKKWADSDSERLKYESLNMDADAMQLVYDLLLQGIEYSDFVSTEDGKCNFECEEFYEFIRFCKMYGNANTDPNAYYSFGQRIDEVKSGNSFTFSFSGGLAEYSKARSMLGEDYISVGYPFAAGAKTFIYCFRGCAVNDLSENKEAAAEFLNMLIDKENQIRYTTYWVRKDVIAEQVKDAAELADLYLDGDTDAQPVFMIDANTYMPLVGRDDGSSYADEYMELMECGAMLSAECEIRDIILEEVQAYFDGDKTEYDVAGVIQSRVSLYLAEKD